jgi:hypothetical protein
MLKAMVIALALADPSAQGPSRVAPPPEPSVRAIVLVGSEYGVPSGLRASGGVLIGKGVTVPGGGRDSGRAGLLAMASAGQGAFTLAVGPALRAFEAPYFPHGVDLSVLFARTRQEPKHARPDASYAGVEFGVVGFGLRFSAGWLHQMAGRSEAGPDNVFVWNVGIQFSPNKW